jgi:hypothetical protein
MQRRNFRFLGLALAGALALGTAACGDDIVIPEAAPTITLTPASITLNVGETATVVANVTNLDGAAFTFENSTPAVASVTATGSTATIKALTAGTTTITVTGTANGKSVKGAVQVRVNAAVPGVKPTISLTPTSTSINVGQQFPLVAIVSNAANPALTFTSSAPAIVTVDANGVVTGVAAGTALVTARLVADTSVKAISSITVNKIGGSAAIGISGIFGGNTTIPANPANIAGLINVQLNVTPGSTDSLRVFVDNTPVSSCSRNFAGTSNDNQVVTCSINTAAIDANGTPVFANGAHVINARLFGNGQVAATATSEQLTFNNADALNLQVTTVGVAGSGSAIGTDGLLWNEGNVVVTATPVVFSGAAGTTIAAPTVCLFNGAAQLACRTATAVAGSNAFTVTFAKANAPGANTPGVNGVTTDNLTARVAGATTTAGQPFPGGISNVIRLDNVAPTAGNFVGNIGTANFINGGFTFNTTTLFGTAGSGNRPVDTAPGSGLAGTRFFVLTTAQFNALTGTAAEINAAFEAQGREVTTGQQLADLVNATPNLRVLASTRDAVGNVTRQVLPFAIGVDVTAPTLTIPAANGPADMSINQPLAFNTQLVEDISGVDANPIRVRVFRDARGVSGLANRCINPNTGLAVGDAGLTASGACPTFTVAQNFVIATPGNGYYTIEIFAVDRAGNASTTITRVVLQDGTAPTVTVNGLSLGAGQVTLSGSLADDVALGSYDTRFFFGAVQLPVTALNTIGTFGVANRVLDQSVSQATPLIRSLRIADGAGAPGVATQVTAGGFGGFDVAGNFGFGTIALSPDVITDHVVGEIPALLETFQLQLAPATVCNNAAGTGCGANDEMTTQLRAVAGTETTPASFNQPFTQVNFYRVIGGVARLVATATNPTIQTTGAARTFTYTTSVNVTGATVGTRNYFAVGISANRDAIQTATQILTINGTN